MRKIALCIGHSRFIGLHRDGGAVSVGGVNEWTWNRSLAGLIVEHLEAAGVETIVVDTYEGSGYTAAMHWLAARLRSLNVGIAVELHFNSAGPTARGHEFLFWDGSAKGKALAEAMSERMVALVPSIPSRGAKAIRGRDRGAEFLRKTHCCAVVAEPFFGSNPDDWRAGTSHASQIARAYAEAILSNH